MRCVAACGSERSRIWRAPSAKAVYAILAPSRDQAGCDSATFGVRVSGRVPLPSLFASQRSPLRTKTISVPSGDHAPSAPASSVREAEPSGTVRTGAPSRAVSRRGSTGSEAAATLAAASSIAIRGRAPHASAAYARRATPLDPRPAPRTRCFLACRNRADAHVFAVEELEPVRERPLRDRVLELRQPRLELTRCELWQSDELAEPGPEARLERRHGQQAPVGGLVEPVARNRSVQKRRHRERMCLVRQRDLAPHTASRALALQQSRKHFAHSR